MKTRVAINGFGRIGRNAFKIAFERADLEVVAINDLTDPKTLAYLLKHDSNYGAYQHNVSYDDTNIIINDKPIKVIAEKDLAALPWRDLQIDVVIEATGLFDEPAKARAHITAGASKVVICATAKGESADTASTIIFGVNEDKLTNASDIISTGSCVTNCISPILGIIDSNFGIEKLMLTTVHSYTSSQNLQDGPGQNLREARAGAQNIVPITNNELIAGDNVLPALKGVIGSLEIRVPTPIVSFSDLTIITKHNVTSQEVNSCLKKAATEPFYQGILAVTEEELVSTDFIGNSHSAVIDLKTTTVVGGNLLKIAAWYDNEWGYCNRLVEMVADCGKILHQQGQHEHD